MKKSIIAIIFLSLTTCDIYGELEPKELDLKILRNIESPREENHDLSWITEEVRPLVVDRLLQISASKSKSARWAIDEKLVIIGHAETIKRIVEELRENPYAGNSLSELTEEGIPYIMPLVYSGSIEKPSITSDVIVPSIRTTAASCLLASIKYSKKLPSETKNWASQIIGTAKQEDKCINLLIQWWEHNKDAITEKRYADATWLPMYKDKPATFSASEMKEREADGELEQTTRKARRVAGSISEKPSNKSTGNTLYIYGLIAAIAAAFAAMIYWKMSSKVS